MTASGVPLRMGVTTQSAIVSGDCSTDIPRRQIPMQFSWIFHDILSIIGATPRHGEIAELDYRLSLSATASDGTMTIRLNHVRMMRKDIEMETQLLERPPVAAEPARPPHRLFIPGPTDVLPQVLAAQTAPMIGHRSDEFEALFAKCEGQLRTLFGTRSRVHRRSVRHRPAGGCDPQRRRRPRGLLCQRRVQPALARCRRRLRQGCRAGRRGVEHGRETGAGRGRACVRIPERARSTQ